MFRSLIFTLTSKPKIFNPPLYDYCSKPNIFNQQLHDYCTKSMQDSIRKLTDQANLQKPMQPPIDSLIRRIALTPTSAKYLPDTPPPVAVVVSVVCILSVSSIAYYFYRRK